MFYVFAPYTDAYGCQSMIVSGKPTGSLERAYDKARAISKRIKGYSEVRDHHNVIKEIFREGQSILSLR